MASLPPARALRFRVFYLALTVVLFGARDLCAAAPVWLKLIGADFVVYSDAPEKQIVDCAVRYAAYRSAMSQLFVEPGHSLPPSLLILYKSDKSYREHLPPGKDPKFRTVNTSGEVDGVALTAFALDSNRDRALALTFEFETIWTLQRIGYALPIWMSQGAGEVLSTLKLEKGKCLVGSTDDHEFETTYTWPRFFEINEGAKDYKSEESLRNFLGQAWGLMHWVLLRENQTRETVRAMGLRLRTEAAADAVSGTMGCKVEEFDKAVARHLSRFKEREMNFDEKAARASFQLGPAPEAEVLAHTSNLLALAGRTLEADTYLDRARALAPELPLVKETWARRMYRDGRRAEALELYRESIAAGSTNFIAYLRSATTRIDDNMTNGSDHAGDGGLQAVTAVQELRQAIRLNPGSLESYGALARAFYISPNVSEADIAELSAGVTTGNAGEFVRYYRGYLHLRLNQRSEFDADLRAVIADPMTSDQLRARASRQLMREILGADGKALDAFIKQRDYASAYDLIAKGEADPLPDIAKGYARMHAAVDKIVEGDPSASAEVRKRAGPAQTPSS